jgi:hypothetical protein
MNARFGEAEIGFTGSDLGSGLKSSESVLSG